MCGRFGLTISPGELATAAGHARWLPVDRRGPQASEKERKKSSAPAAREEHRSASIGEEECLCSLEGTDAQNYVPNHNRRPTTMNPVLVNSSLGRVLMNMRWGLVPRTTRVWPVAGTSAGEFLLINARAEGLLGKSVFRAPLEDRLRGVLLVECFYEWKLLGKDRRQPFRVERKDGKLLSLACIYDVWSRASENRYSFTIITVEVSKELEWLHDRMPAILLGDDDVRDWLDIERVHPDQACKLLSTLQGDVLRWFPVSSDLSNEVAPDPKLDQFFPPSTNCPSDVRKRPRLEHDHLIVHSTLSKDTPKPEKRNSKISQGATEKSVLAKVDRSKTSQTTMLHFFAKR